MNKAMFPLDGLGFMVVAKAESDHWASFQVFDIIGIDEQSKAAVYEREGATSSGDWVADIGEAKTFMHGHVKWDGCSNWYFDVTDDGMLHACSREELVRVGEAMAKCWDWAKQNLPAWLDI